MIESEMQKAIFSWFGTKLELGDSLKYAAREVCIPPTPGGGFNKSELDVVGYNKEEKVFKVVECKLHSGDEHIAEAFGQIARYRMAMEGNILAFLDAFTRKSPMRFGRMMEATSGGSRISVEFYVALTDKACKKLDYLRSWKRQYPDTGIFRLKDDLSIRHYLKEADGTHDDETPKARAVSFEITSSLGLNAPDIAMPTRGAGSADLVF